MTPPAESASDVLRLFAKFRESTRSEYAIFLRAVENQELGQDVLVDLLEGFFKDLQCE